MTKNLYPLTCIQVETSLSAVFFSKKATDLFSLGIYITVKDNPNIDAIKKAFNHYLEVNDALRCRFKITLKGIRQYIEDYKPVDIPIVSLNNKEELYDSMNKVRRINGVLLGKKVYKAYIFTYENSATLFLSIHHMVFDGYSMGVTFKEITEYYDLYNNGENPKDQKRKFSLENYLKEHAEYKKSQTHKDDLKWWKQKFDERKNFSVIKPISKPNTKVKYKAHSIGEENYAKLTDLAKQLMLPVNSIVSSIVSLTISKIKNIENFTIAHFGHGRTTYLQKNTIGNMVRNTLVFYDINKEKRIDEFFKDNFLEYLECAKHSNVNVFEILKAGSNASKQAKSSEFYGLVISNLNVSDYGEVIDDRFECGNVTFDYQPSQYYCMLNDNHKDKLEATIIHQSGIVTDDEFNKYFVVFDELLNKIITDSTQLVKNIVV